MEGVAVGEGGEVFEFAGHAEGGEDEGAGREGVGPFGGHQAGVLSGEEMAVGRGTLRAAEVGEVFFVGLGQLLAAEGDGEVEALAGNVHAWGEGQPVGSGGKEAVNPIVDLANDLGDAGLGNAQARSDVGLEMAFADYLVIEREISTRGLAGWATAGHGSLRHEMVSGRATISVYCTLH